MRVQTPTGPVPRDDAGRGEKRVLWGLFALSLGIRLFFLLLSDNEDGDSFARIQLARSVVDDGRLIPTEIWLPVQFWILSIPYALGLHSQLWARLLMAIAGAGTVPIACRFMARVFNQRAALAGGLILALNPLHIRFSVVTVSEVFLVFFLVTGLWGLCEWIVLGRLRHLTIGALAMNLACGNRTEAWLVVWFIMAVVLFQRHPGWSEAFPWARGRAFLFAALSSLFAAGWMIFSYVGHGDALHIATLNTGRVKADPVYQRSIGWYTVAFWPAVLLASLGPLGFVTTVRGAVRSAVAGPGRYLGLLFFGFVGIYYVQNFRSGMITDARYALFLEILLILSAGPALEAWGAPPSRTRWIGHAAAWLLAVWAMAILPLGTVSEKMQSISPCPRVESEIREVDAWLRSQPVPGVIALGPDLGRYGPWLSLLDNWYPGNRVVVTKSEEAFVQAIQGNESGFVVFRKETSTMTARWIDALPAGTLRRERSGSEFEAYRWSTQTGGDRSEALAPEAKLPLGM